MSRLEEERTRGGRERERMVGDCVPLPVRNRKLPVVAKRRQERGGMREESRDGYSQIFLWRKFCEL